MKTIFLSAISALMFTACNSSIQTSSGEDYARDIPQSQNRLSKVSEVEPLLKFPAKFCFVKMRRALMVYPEASESQAWAQMAARHQDWGSFQEVSPAVVNMVQGEQSSPYSDAKADMNAVRLAAGRQHCEAVLAYELRGGGAASALLFDGRNGYTYLTASTTGANDRDATQKLIGEVESSMSALARELK